MALVELTGGRVSSWAGWSGGVTGRSAVSPARCVVETAAGGEALMGES